MARLDQIQWQLQKKCQSRSGALQNSHRFLAFRIASQIQGSETLAASLTSNARNARVDRRPQAFPNQYDEAVSICVLKLKALRLNLLSNENSVGSKGSDHTHSHILCEELGPGPLRSSASVLALASSSSSMILTGSESSLAAKCSGVRPQRRRKA